MKIAGKELATRNTRIVHLVRGEERYPIKVSALPPGWHDRMRAIGLFDNRPKPKMVAKQQGGKVLRDPSNGVIYEEDTQDPKFKEAMIRYNGRIAALRLAEHLSADDSVSFDATKPEGNDRELWLAYADAVMAEIDHPEHGFTAGEIEQILEVGDNLDSSIDVGAGLQHFLPPA